MDKYLHPEIICEAGSQMFAQTLNISGLDKGVFVSLFCKLCLVNLAATMQTIAFGSISWMKDLKLDMISAVQWIYIDTKTKTKMI